VGIVDLALLIQSGPHSGPCITLLLSVSFAQIE